jgi:hypothetical protein
VKDPWRLDPQAEKKKRKPAAEPTRKINLDEKDLDADIRPKRTCPIRFKRCTFEICSSEIATQDDAMRLLAECVVALRAAGLGPALDADNIGAGPTDKRPTGASSIASTKCAVWFRGKTLEEGTLALAKLLGVASRHPQGSEVLRKYGVRAMLRA